MRDFRKPEFMKAAGNKKGHHWLLEMCICLLIYFVGSIVMSVVQIPAYMVYLLGNSDYMKLMQSGTLDIQKNMQMIMNIMSNMPEWMYIVILASTGALIFAYCFYCTAFEKRSMRSMGFRKKGVVTQYLLGAVLAIALFCVAYLLCFATGSVKMQGMAGNVIPGYILAYLGAYLLQGMAEEVICRGQLMVSLSKRYSVSFSVFVSAMFFAFLHSMNSGLSSLAYVNLFLFGMFLGLLFVECENIWIVGAFHGIWNFMEGNVFGISVSGNPKQNSLFLSQLATGRDSITGGKFGLEGGFCVTVVLVIGIAVVIARMNRKGKVVTVSLFDAVMPKEMPENQQQTQEQNAPSYGDNSPFQPRPNQRPDATSENAQKDTLDNAQFQNPDIAPQQPTPVLKPAQKPEPNVPEKTGFDENYFS